FVCTLDLETDLENRPAAARLRASLMDYLGSPAFAPQGDLTGEELKTLFGEPGLTASANSMHPDYPANNAVDADPATIWHTDWNHRHGPPFQLTVELPKERTVVGFRYIPRQDKPNGRIKEYRIEALGEEGSWIKLTERRAFPAGTETVDFRFEEPVSTNRLRLHIFNAHDGRPMASAAEFLPILAGESSAEGDVRDLGLIPGFNDESP
ncbi:MAG: hypothetical protein GVY10_05665, partial [Verrucomicrobia bacterium]|nr:hypothetical protein [Verrucomicrobiota bacterium]